MEVGFIGLGIMGRPMASNLCRKGFRLVVNDINSEAVRELEQLQASSAPTIAEVATRSDRAAPGARWSAGEMMPTYIARDAAIQVAYHGSSEHVERVSRGV